MIMGRHVLLSCALTACVVPRSTDNPVHTFLLTIDESAWRRVSRGQPGIHGVLVVGLPQAEAGFEQPRMAYLQRPYEVSYYATNVWVDTPARMLAPLLVQSLERHRASGVWWCPMPTAVRGDYRLDISGLVVQQEFLQRPSGTRIRLRAQLTETKEQRIMGVRSLESFEPAPSEDAYGGVLAANRAVTRVLEIAE
jgi:cholesterol transport system auxiliary component